MADRYYCSWCGQMPTVTKDGRLHQHKTHPAHGEPTKPCPGSGLPVKGLDQQPTLLPDEEQT